MSFITEKEAKSFERKIWFIAEGTLICNDGFITTEIEKEFEISPDMFESIIYASGIQEEKIGNININRKHSLLTITKIKRKAISPMLRWKIMKRDKFKCVKCGKGVNDTDCLQVDHIIPVTKGGSNEESNLQTLCWECNIGKGNKA